MIGQLFGLMPRTSERDSKRGPSLSNVSQRNKNIRRAKLAVQNGQYRKAIKALSSEGLAEPSSEVLTEMIAKHPKWTHPLYLTVLSLLLYTYSSL